MKRLLINTKRNSDKISNIYAFNKSSKMGAINSGSARSQSIKRSKIKSTTLFMGAEVRVRDRERKRKKAAVRYMAGIHFTSMALVCSAKTNNLGSCLEVDYRTS